MDTGFETAHGASENGSFADGEPPWVALLGSAIESEMLPRLLVANQREMTGAEPWDAPTGADVAAFVALILVEDMERARAAADRVVVHYGSRDALLNDLLAPAARLLGEMWDRDECDFLTVTLGVYRLDQIMKETATAAYMGALKNNQEYRVLLLPAPGEQHSFGLGMVADSFREGGWCVRSGPALTRAAMLALARDEWFDVVGLSVSSERTMHGLSATIRALRAGSCNPRVGVLLGGRAVMDDGERARFLGADMIVTNGKAALDAANDFVAASVTASLHRSMTKMVDNG